MRVLCTLLCIRPWDTEKSNESREIERKRFEGSFVRSDPFEMQIEFGFYHRPSREKRLYVEMSDIALTIR